MSTIKNYIRRKLLYITIFELNGLLESMESMSANEEGDKCMILLGGFHLYFSKLTRNFYHLDEKDYIASGCTRVNYLDILSTDIFPNLALKLGYPNFNFSEFDVQLQDWEKINEFYNQYFQQNLNNDFSEEVWNALLSIMMLIEVFEEVPE